MDKNNKLPLIEELDNQVSKSKGVQATDLINVVFYDPNKEIILGDDLSFIPTVEDED
jgi:hypothetical protein